MHLRDPKDPVAYARAYETVVPIELETASYHSCPFVRARAASKTTRVHVLERLANDLEPSVVYGVVENRACPPAVIHAISTSLEIHSDPRWHMVWEALIRHPAVLESVRDMLKHKERERRRTIRKKAGLPPLLELAPPVPPPVRASTKIRLVLAVLRTYIQNIGKPKEKQVPWGITPLGWSVYDNHPSRAVRYYTRLNPEFPKIKD